LQSEPEPGTARPSLLRKITDGRDDAQGADVDAGEQYGKKGDEETGGGRDEQG
jgi:hypothetical protein